eukprot:2451456-Alexandrium_andersonii.AAC.1
MFSSRFRQLLGANPWGHSGVEEAAHRADPVHRPTLPPRVCQDSGVAIRLAGAHGGDPSARRSCD